MWNSIKKLLSPPVFEDGEKTRVAYLLNIVIWVLIVVILMRSIGALFVPSTPAILLVIFGIFIGIMAALLVLVRVGYVKVAGYILISLSWIVVTLAIGTTGGLQGSSFWSYAIIILMAGMILGGWAAVGYGALSIVAGIIIYNVESSGMLTLTLDTSLEAALANTIPRFITVALLVFIYDQGFKKVLTRMRRNEHKLAESNEELLAIQETLEDRIAARTQGLETVATLSERFAGILDREELLEELVNRVNEDFNYYYTHIYLVDEQRQNLVMTAGVGEAGAEMKAKGHSIAVDALTSLVARAARTKEIVSVDNVREAEDWLPNPLLPDTHCEMAIPIIIEEEVVGVLDVQEDEVGGLDEGDANLLRSLAGHVAVALANARLFEEVQESLQTIQTQQQTIQDISTPVIPVLNTAQGGIIVMPLVGTVDSMRARDITRSLLAGISKHKARIVILDVTGVSLMDTGIVNHLNKTIQAAQLKGAQTIITGISDVVAESIVDLGIDWSTITTLSDLQTGLIIALESLELRIERAT